MYGVTAYTVVRRTPEIGIRMALGAARGRVIGMVMQGALLQAAAGLAIGVPVAMLCVRFVKSQLYDIAHVDGVVMAGAIGVLVAAAMRGRDDSGAKSSFHRSGEGAAGGLKHQVRSSAHERSGVHRDGVRSRRQA
jgi:ABC-type antimicrobial peptide transport system permease subunit